MTEAEKDMPTYSSTLTPEEIRSWGFKPAQDRITELEAELKAARETIADKQAWIERIVKNAADELNKQKAELAAAKDAAEGYYVELADAAALIEENRQLQAEAARLRKNIKLAYDSLNEWDDEYNEDSATPRPIQFAIDRLAAALQDAPESEGACPINT